MTAAEPSRPPQRDASARAGDPDGGTDLELVRLAQAGDAQAFGELVEQNRRAVYRAAYAALGSPADADDVAQEAFVTAYQKLGSFRGESSFRTWLLSIAWRKALDRRRNAIKWLRLTVTHDEFTPLPSAERSHEERMAGDELRQVLRRMIASLPRKLRDALLLAGSGDYSYDQIGQMLRIPVGTVKWRVSEARRVLKQKLVALGYGYD